MALADEQDALTRGEQRVVLRDLGVGRAHPAAPDSPTRGPDGSGKGEPSPAQGLRRRRRLLELRDLDLSHLQHRCHGALRLLTVGVADQLVERLRDDLPGDAVAVLEPSARPRFTAVGERVPVAVDLFLRLADDLERDRLVEREVGPAVQREELLPVELERDLHDCSLGPRPSRAVAADVDDLRVREDRRVELRRLLAFGVEPQAGSDLLHRSSSIGVSVCVRPSFHRKVIAMRTSGRPRRIRAWVSTSGCWHSTCSLRSRS